MEKFSDKDNSTNQEQSPTPKMRYQQIKKNGMTKSCLVFSLKSMSDQSAKRIRLNGVVEG